MAVVDFEYPYKFSKLFGENKRIRIARGGRGSGKSWGFARKCLERSLVEPLTILCTRELQNSIKDSVHKLVCNQIDKLGLQSHFEYGESYIRGKNGTQFIFKGLKHNANEIKSMEGIDICWMEEGQGTSQASLDLLLPTIRSDNSELWIGYNPMNLKDPIHVMAENSPEDTVVVDINWRDNPWWNSILEAERQRTLKNDPDKYDWMWEGHCLEILEGTYYGSLLKMAKDEKRITNVPYDPSCEVITAWDLGIGDSTSIWFAQYVGQEVHLIDYYENSGVALDHYVRVLREKPYVYAEEHIFPHDAGAKELGTGKTRQEVLQNLGITCNILKRSSVDDGINAVRNMLPMCWFDKDKCEKGLDALKAYHKKWDEKRAMWYGSPVHDWSSHSADAFRYLALGGGKPDGGLDLNCLMDNGSGWMGA